MKTEVLSALVFTLFLHGALGAEDSFAHLEGQIRSHADSMAEACVSIKTSNGAWGSGVIVSPTGMIFSAAHVYHCEGEKVTVFMNHGRRATAEVVRRDRRHDIAVLLFGGKRSKVLPAKVVGDEGIENGRALVAAGHASGFNSERRSPLRVGFGFLARGKSMIYTTCRITAGDSGGPLYDEAGVLRGVHHTMDGKGKFSAHVPVQRFFQIWPELAETVGNCVKMLWLVSVVNFVLITHGFGKAGDWLSPAFLRTRHSISPRRCERHTTPGSVRQVVLGVCPARSMSREFRDGVIPRSQVPVEEARQHCRDGREAPSPPT